MCSDPIWKELNAACPVFEWEEARKLHISLEEGFMRIMTKGCTGQHRITLDPEEFPSFSEECDGKYQCSDRSDEAACAELPVSLSSSYELDYSQFDCKSVY